MAFGLFSLLFSPAGSVFLTAATTGRNFFEVCIHPQGRFRRGEIIKQQCIRKLLALRFKACSLYGQVVEQTYSCKQIPFDVTAKNLACIGNSL